MAEKLDAFAVKFETQTWTVFYELKEYGASLLDGCMT